MSVQRKGQLSCNACISVLSVAFHHKSDGEAGREAELWNSLERFDEHQVTATVVSIDRSLALTVSLKQSPGGEPLCCKINAVVLSSRGPDTHKTAPFGERGPVCRTNNGADPVMCASQRLQTLPHTRLCSAGTPVAGRRDNDTTC